MGCLQDVRDELSATDIVCSMNDDVRGRLSDGTPLSKVVADMPVEVRDGGSNDWRFGYAVRVEAHDIFPRVWVEIGSNGSTPYFANYVRRYKPVERKKGKRK